MAEPMPTLRIRVADAEADASRVAEIYRPAVMDSIASFEEVPPDAAEMAARMRRTMARTPWLVAEAGDAGVIGYAYAAPHRDRAGYRWSVDLTVYLDASWQGRGVGRRLYTELIAILLRQGFVNAYAGIALPNPASVALHRSIGMEEVGIYRRVGFKFGTWYDVAWYGMRLRETDGPPPEPIPLPHLDDAQDSERPTAGRRL